MRYLGRFAGSIGTFAGVLVCALLLAGGAAFAGKASAGKPAVAAPPSLDPDGSALSPSALGERKLGASAANKPDLQIPDSIKFGDHTLRFNTDPKSVDSIPRVGLDTVDRHVLPTQKDNDLPPTYFGLTFTTPTR